MATEQSVLDAMGRAMWDPQPTTSDFKAQQLAFALGYPTTWRVVRTLEPIPSDVLQEEGEEEAGEEEKINDSDGDAMAEEMNRCCIVDRIYAGEPGTDCDMWFNHQSAMMASQDWEEKGSDPCRYKGGHLLPREALFSKGDKVEVLFEEKWWEAKVLRRKEHSEGFRYQVFYSTDKSKQGGIPEERIRPLSNDATTAKDPTQTAVQLGLGSDWQAVLSGNNRWKITSPTGEIFKSKKAALEACLGAEAAGEDTGADSGGKDEGDPPWRRTGHEYLDRSVLFRQEHAVTARRTITLEQIGRVAGWISETDVDQAGEPGFLSEKTGLPAKLFHVVFENDKPHLHKYGNLLVDYQDLEEFELEACLIPKNEEPPASKKQRKTR